MITHLKTFAFLVSVLCATTVAAADLVVNGSIEQYHGIGKPYAWPFRKNEASRVNTNSSRSRTGRNSLEFDLSRANEPEWNGMRFPVRAGARYRAEFYFLTTEVFSSGELLGFVRWWGDESTADWKGQALVRDGIGQSTTAGDWIEASQVVTAPAGARFGEFHLWSADTTRGPNGRAFLDDFSLNPIVSGVDLPSPFPLDGSDDSSLYTVLRWNSIDAATAYDLYVGTSFEKVATAGTNSAEFRSAIPETGSQRRYSLTLEPYTHYFWRVDPRIDGTPMRGEVLSLATGFDLLENLVRPTRLRLGARDNQNRGLDALEILENPNGPGYLGVYHTLIDGEFQARLATSNNLIDWTYRTLIAANADMPSIAYHAESGGFLIVHEQWGQPGSRSPSNLRFRYYSNLSALLAGKDSRDYLVPLTRSAANGSNLEGTPNFLSIDSSGNRISIGFHYFDADSGRVDRNARGTLRGFLSGNPSWTSSDWDDVNNALVAVEADANIGDRDSGLLFGKDIMAIEGQYIRNDFGSWRPWYWDVDRGQVFPLHMRTRGGSNALGNMTWGMLTAPNGKRAFYGAAFFFSEGASPGEAGQAIYYTELNSDAYQPWPENTASDVSSDTQLYWLAAAGASRHDVYLGESQAEVDRATPSSTQHQSSTPTTSYSPNLQSGRSYFWRVDTTFQDGSVRKGSVWNFETSQSLDNQQAPGDCNLDGNVDLSDAVCVFELLFLGTRDAPCGASLRNESARALLDWNGDANVDISDGIAELGFLFGASTPRPHVLGQTCVALADCSHACR